MITSTQKLMIAHTGWAGRDELDQAVGDGEGEGEPAGRRWRPPDAHGYDHLHCVDDDQAAPGLQAADYERDVARVRTASLRRRRCRRRH
jgi:hypothetical protein